MKPFESVEEMIETHEKMFGEAGRVCAELIVRHVALFDEPLNPLRIRLVLAPFELGAYNRHYGYTNVVSDIETGFRHIVGNRHICEFDNHGSFVLYAAGSRHVGAEDFLVHEMTHHRQGILLKRNKWTTNGRGVHRDKGWYSAISEAAPRYLGVQFPEHIWPKLQSKRVKGKVSKIESPNRLTEVEVNYWPGSFRKLIEAGDQRLVSIDSSTHELQVA
jgi:hypothetical protein